MENVAPRPSKRLIKKKQDSRDTEEHASQTLEDGWMVEYCASVISVASLAGLVILLAVSDNRSRFDWHGVTINTLVALLSTTSRISLMVTLAETIGQSKWILFARSARPLYDFELVDRASRSSFGRLNVLWRMPLGIASIGALAALLSLAFDPFAQQLVQSRAITKYLSDPLTQLSVAKRYAEGTMYGSPLLSAGATCNTSNPGPLINDPPSFEADFEMQSAILYGLGNTDMAKVIQQLTWRCPSGNCTWGSVDSLAVCSRCTDVLRQTTSFSTSDDQYSDFASEISFFENSTAFALPNGIYIANGNGRNHSVLDSLMISFGTGNPPETLTFQDSDTLIWAMSMLRAQPDPTSNKTVWPHLPIDAIECGFYYCVNTYTSKVSSGVLSEAEQPSNDSSRHYDSWQPEVGPSQPQLSEEQIKSIQFDVCQSSVPRTDLMLGSGFNISWEAVNSVSMFMNTYFASTRPDTQSSTPLNDTPNANQNCNGYFVQLTEAHRKWEPAVMQPLQQAQDLNSTFTNIARSMTNSIRSKSQTPPLQGKNGYLQVIIEVQWPWITLPIIVVAASIIQLAISVLSTRRYDAPIWKCSSLATMSRVHEASDRLARSRLVSQMVNLGLRETVELLP